MYIRFKFWYCVQFWWFLCEIRTKCGENSEWIVIEFGLNLMKLAVISFFEFSNLMLPFSAYFLRMLTIVFLDLKKKLVKLQNAINKIRVAVSFFSNLFLCLSQLSQATLWPELPNFVQKLCSFKRVIYDLIHEWKSYGGVKTDID